MTDQFCVELAPVEGEVDVEVDAIESAVRSVHPLKVFFEILAGEVGGERDTFFDSWSAKSIPKQAKTLNFATYVDLSCTRGIRPRHRSRARPRTSTLLPVRPGGRS